MTSSIGRALTQTAFTTKSSAKIGYLGAESYKREILEALWPFGKGLLSVQQRGVKHLLGMTYLVPLMIMETTSSLVTSSDTQMSTSSPFFIIAILSQKSKTSWMS